MYYVYILLSRKDGRWYIGSTSDLKRRYAEHLRGCVTATKYRRPLILMGYEAYKTKAEASRREIFLKTSDGRKDLKKRFNVSII